MDEEGYKRAVKSCALDKDIDNFDHGCPTEIVQRGINMSGGQKQRIQLARAVYDDADIYLLDDPFSAVDAQTAAVLFNVRQTPQFLTQTLKTIHSFDRFIKLYSMIAGLRHGCSREENCRPSNSSSGVSF